MSTYRLAKKDRDYLAEKGYSKDDIQEINYALTRTTYTLVKDNDEQLTITRAEAEQRLGHEEWLSGLSRSAFYIDSTRWTENGEKIKFHSKVYA